MMVLNDNVFVYRVDKEDVITSVSANWQTFAHDNAWHIKSKPEDVVGNSLWDFIEGSETKQLYKEIFKRIRIVGKRLTPIPFRCDSPQQRRFLELFLTPLSDGRIQITSRIIRSEQRDPVALLDSEIPRSNVFVKICSMCKKIEIAENEWVEVELGVTQLEVFVQGDTPRLSHGLCPVCLAAAMAELGEVGLSR